MLDNADKYDGSKLKIRMKGQATFADGVAMPESAHYRFGSPRVKTAPTAMSVMTKSAHFSVI